MNKILLSPLTLLLISTFTPSTFAQNNKATTPTSEALSDKFNDQVNQLKEKIASRVAELNLVEKRGITGSVSDVSGNKITLIDTQGKTRFVDVDEITKFSAPNAKASFGISDLTKGTNINVLGLYNKQSKRILARFVRTAVTPKMMSAVISDIDSKNFVLTVLTEDQKLSKIDIPTAAKISSYTKTDGLTKLGFSKLTIGDRMIASGFPDKNDSSLLIADRIIVFPDLPKNPKIIVPEPSNITTTPAPSGEKKLTPIDQ